MKGSPDEEEENTQEEEEGELIITDREQVHGLSTLDS